MVTNGCVAFTAPGCRIALTEQLPEETISEVEEKIEAGFRTVSVRCIDTPVQAGLSFQEFQKQYELPKPIYSCIKCGGDLTIILRESKGEFLNHGTIEV